MLFYEKIGYKRPDTLLTKTCPSCGADMLPSRYGSTRALTWREEHEIRALAQKYGRCGDWGWCCQRRDREPNPEYRKFVSDPYGYRKAHGDPPERFIECHYWEHSERIRQLAIKQRQISRLFYLDNEDKYRVLMQRYIDPYFGTDHSDEAAELFDRMIAEMNQQRGRSRRASMGDVDTVMTETKADNRCAVQTGDFEFAERRI